jgi:DtxR family Mn-dependent transcriptional regulator
MSSPILWSFIIIIFLALAWFAPRWGLRLQFHRWRAAVERQRIQDALKLLLDNQWSQHFLSARQLAADLHLADQTTLRLLERMQAQGLLEVSGEDLRLTAEGEQTALQVTRAHRLLERYLADEARMPLEQIHQEAHRLEHRLTPEQVYELDAAMGFPQHDPHGDPIPSARGQVPAGRSTPLTAWEPGTPGKIVHLEDEPPIAYAQILAEGLRLGQVVRILEALPQRYVLSDGEKEYRLAPAVAANVHVAPLVEAELPGNGILSLGQLAHNQAAEIIALDEACQGFTRRRFLDMGLTPGTRIFPELLNAFGDPRAYRVRGTLIALRKDQAAQIWVRPV